METQNFISGAEKRHRKSIQNQNLSDGNQGPSKSLILRGRFLLLAVFILFSLTVLSQPIGTSTVPCYTLNTAINPTNITSTLPTNTPDANWWAQTPGSPIVPAKVVGPTGCSWAGAGSNFNWISYPGFGCGAPLSKYSCNSPLPTGVNYHYYLPVTNTAFAVDMRIRADGWVNEIWVNGFLAWSCGYSGGGTPPSHKNVGIEFRWCKWGVGTNTISIYTKTDPSAGGACQHAGLQVESYCFGSQPTISWRKAECLEGKRTPMCLASIGSFNPLSNFDSTIGALRVCMQGTCQVHPTHMLRICYILH